MTLHRNQRTQRTYIWVCLLLCAVLIAACQASPTEAPPMEEPPTEVAPTEVAPTDVPPTTAPAEETSEEDTPTETPAPTATPEPTATPAPTDTPAPTATPEPTDTPPEATATEPPPTATQSAGAAAPVAPPPPDNVVHNAALPIIPDADPAPPLTVIVTTNQALDGYRYRVAGLLRNDAAEPYTGLNVIVTFYRESGLHYGPIQANCACPVLAPGEVCPFIAEATSKTIAGVMFHPNGYATGRVPAPVTVSGIGRYTDGAGYVHLTGSISNPNAYAIKNTSLNGMLLDGEAIVSLGTDLIIEVLEPGASARFDIPVKAVAYNNVRVYAHAEQHIP